MFDIGTSLGVNFHCPRLLKLLFLVPHTWSINSTQLNHNTTFPCECSLELLASLPLQLWCPHTECPRTGRRLESPPSRRAAPLTQHLRGGQQRKTNREDRVGVFFIRWRKGNSAVRCWKRGVFHRSLLLQEVKENSATGRSWTHHGIVGFRWWQKPRHTAC